MSNKSIIEEKIGILESQIETLKSQKQSLKRKILEAEHLLQKKTKKTKTEEWVKKTVDIKTLGIWHCLLENIKKEKIDKKRIFQLSNLKLEACYPANSFQFPLLKRVQLCKQFSVNCPTIELNVTKQGIEKRLKENQINNEFTPEETIVYLVENDYLTKEGEERIANDLLVPMFEHQMMERIPEGFYHIMYDGSDCKFKHPECIFIEEEGVLIEKKYYDNLRIEIPELPEIDQI
eukprot:gene521-8034_t